MFNSRFALRLLMLLCAPLLLALGGCSYVETHRYDEAKVDLMAEGSGKVAVITQDLRPEVLNGDFTPDYTGIVRAFFGNASVVTTASRRPLAEDLTAAVADGLRARGFEVVTLIAAPREDSRAVRDKLFATGAERTITITLADWHSSTWMRTAVTYDITMELVEKQGGTGESRGRVSQEGRKSLKGSLLHPFVYARQVTPRFFEEQLEGLLNREEARDILAN